MEMKPIALTLLVIYGVSGVDTDGVSVMEGDSVTLNTGLKTNQQEDIKWYFNNIRIARLNGDLNKICTDVQCNEDTERFRDRLKLDHQTGSLTITNTRTSDSGEYKLYISSNNIEKIFSVTVHAGPGSSLSGGAIGGISAAVMVVAVLAVIAGAIIKDL